MFTQNAPKPATLDSAQTPPYPQIPPKSAQKTIKKAHFRQIFSLLREEFPESAKSYPQLYPCDPQLYRPESQLCRSYAVFIPYLLDKKTGRIT
jgi:hypothetical protein